MWFRKKKKKKKLCGQKSDCWIWGELFLSCEYAVTLLIESGEISIVKWDILEYYIN